MEAKTAVDFGNRVKCLLEAKDVKVVFEMTQTSDNSAEITIGAQTPEDIANEMMLQINRHLDRSQFNFPWHVLFCIDAPKATLFWSCEAYIEI